MKNKTIQNFIDQAQQDRDYYADRLIEFEKEYDVLGNTIKEFRLNLASSEETLKQLKTLIPGESREQKCPQNPDGYRNGYCTNCCRYELIKPGNPLYRE